MINGNGPQIYQALNNGHLDKDTNALYFSIGPIFNAVGRSLVAILDGRVHNKTFLLMFAPPFLGLAALIIAVAPLSGLLFAFICSGFGDSLTWAARGLVLKQLFNGKSFGLIYNFMFTLAVGSPFIFNLGIFAPLYDRAAHRHGTFPNCNQRDCVTDAMLIGVAVSAFGTIAGVVLYRRTQRRMLHLKALKLEQRRKAMLS